jgi:hypothetical protein
MSIKYREGYKYQLADDCSVMSGITGYDIKTEYIELRPSGIMILKKGYACDGPSGPTIDTPSSMRGAFFHDGGYQLIREKLLPPECREALDYLLYRLCVEDGMYELRARAWYDAVRAFAASAADPKNDRPILEAP